MGPFDSQKTDSTRQILEPDHFDVIHEKNIAIHSENSADYVFMDGSSIKLSKNISEFSKIQHNDKLIENVASRPDKSTMVRLNSDFSDDHTLRLISNIEDNHPCKPDQGTRMPLKSELNDFFIQKMDSKIGENSPVKPNEGGVEPLKSELTDFFIDKVDISIEQNQVSYSNVTRKINKKQKEGLSVNGSFSITPKSPLPNDDIYSTTSLLQHSIPIKTTTGNINTASKHNTQSQSDESVEIYQMAPCMKNSEFQHETNCFWKSKWFINTILTAAIFFVLINFGFHIVYHLRLQKHVEFNIENMKIDKFVRNLTCSNYNLVPSNHSIRPSRNLVKYLQAAKKFLNTLKLARNRIETNTSFLDADSKSIGDNYLDLFNKCHDQ